MPQPCRASEIPARGYDGRDDAGGATFNIPEYGPLTFAQAWNRCTTRTVGAPPVIINSDFVSIALYFEDMSEKYREDWLDD